MIFRTLRSPWVLPGTLILFTLLPRLAVASACSGFASLVTIDRAQVGDAFAMQDLMDQQITIENQIALRVASEFLAQTQGLEEPLKCVQNYQERSRFLLTLQASLIDLSLSRLRASPSPHIRKFMRLVDQRSNAGKDLTIRLTGHVLGPRPVDKKAGFHRADQTIFMDIEAISANEWMIILVHELSHYLDDRIFNSLKAFSDSATVTRIVAYSQRTDQLKNLSSSERNDLKQWLVAGLNLGLLAEYRAWAATVLVYDDGLKEGLWRPVDWMQSFRDQLGTPLDPWRNLYLFLNQRGVNSSHTLFVWPLVQGALQEVRQSLAQTPPDLGLFGQLL